MKKKLLVLLLSLSMIMSGTVLTSAETLPENEVQKQAEQNIKEETQEEVKEQTPEQKEEVEEQAPVQQEEKKEEAAPEEKAEEEPVEEQKKEEEKTEEPAPKMMMAPMLTGTSGTNPSPVSGLVYDGDSHILISNIQTYAKAFPSNGDVKYVYKVDNGSYGDISDADKAYALRRVDAGEYKVYYKTQKYSKSGMFGSWSDNSSESSVTVNIAKATGASASAATGLVENGQALCLIGSTKTNWEQTLYYSTDNTNWSKTKPTATTAGVYHVYWKADASKNYNANSGDFDVEVGGTGEITAGCLSLDKTHFDYLFGAYRTPKVSVVVKGKTLKANVDYEISGDTSKSNPGKYTITVTGIGNYSGSDSKSWEVGTDINDVTMSLFEDSFEYNGNSHEPVVVGLAAITKSGDTSKRDRGSYTLRVSGNNELGYYGTRNFSWEITARDLSKCVVTVDSPEYTGEDLSVTPVVRYGLLDLISGDTVPSSDYTVTGNTAKESGKHTLTITAKDDKNITGSKEVEWTIQKKSATATVTKNSGLTFNGNPQKLVTESAVSEGCDVEYICVDNEWALPAMIAYAEVADNWSSSIPEKTNASTYYVLYRIKGSGNYKDVSWNQNYIEVTIHPTKVGVEWTTGEYTYNGKLQGPTAKVTGELFGGSCDCTVTGKHIDAGTYTAKADLSLLDNYEGNYELKNDAKTEQEYTIKPKTFSNSCIVAEQLGTTPFTGETQTPAFVVYDSDTTLPLIVEKDFTIESFYAAGQDSERIESGTYTATLKGKGNYSGDTMTVSWTITTGKMIVLLDKQTYEYNGTDKSEAALKHLVVTNLKGKELTAGTHYEIVEAGTDAGCVDVNKALNPYKITIQGKGNYAGDPIELHYWITPRDINEANIALDHTSFYYNGESQAPVVTVTDIVSDNDIITSLDYEISGETSGTHANYSIGEAPVTLYEIFVTGKGNYTGVASAYWRIKSIDLAKCEVSGVPTYTYDGTSHTVDVNSLTVTYKDGDNTIVVPKSNYKLEVTPQSNAGHYTATLKNENGFVLDLVRYQDVIGEKTINWTINSAGANLTIDPIPDQIYTGAPITLSNLVVKLNGTPITSGYSVRYENNVEVGTATVYVSVSGNVVGSASANFNIVYGDEHNVKFYVDGQLWAEQTVKHGEKASVPKEPTKEGYTFAGWTIGNAGADKGEVYLFDSAVMCDLALHAKWVSDKRNENIEIKVVPDGIVAASDIKAEDIPLTNKEEEAIENGAHLRVEVEVKAVEFTPSESDAAAMEGALNDKQHVGVYIEITINKYLDDVFSGSVHETINPIKITITVPEELRAKGRLYFVGRVHNGQAKVLVQNKKASSEWTISFGSDRFSTYMLGYQEAKVDVDKEDSKSDKSSNSDSDKSDNGVKTGDQAPLGKMFGLFSIAVLGAWVVIRSKKKIVK